MSNSHLDRFGPQLRGRIESFCIYLGVSADDFVKTGMPTAIAQLGAFVEDLPPKYQEPKNFCKLLLNNFDFVYSLLEAVGGDAITRNHQLSEQLEELQSLFDDVHDQQLEDLSKVSKYHHTERWLIGGAEDQDVISIDADEEDSEFGDDVPLWKITVFLGPDRDKAERVTTTCDHFEMARHFKHAVKVSEDPHPEYDGIDVFDVPRDDQPLATEEDWDDESGDHDPALGGGFDDEANDTMHDSNQHGRGRTLPFNRTEWLEDDVDPTDDSM
jgi:hypothetical protein